MAKRQELDDALESENKALIAAAERHQKQVADVTEKLMDALNNLSSKHENDEDFSVELAKVNQHVTSLNQLATTPLAASAEPPPTSPSTATGAAGSTVGGPEMHASVVAAGAEEPKPDDHAGSATTAAEPKSDDQSKPIPVQSTLEWGTGDNKGMVRDTPDGEWREPTQDETNAHQS